MKDKLDHVYEKFGDKMCLCPFFGAFYQTFEIVNESTIPVKNTVRPCSLIVSNPGSWDVTEDSILESRNNNYWKKIRKKFIEGKFLEIEDCRVCTLTENVGGNSPRHGSNHTFNEFLDIDFASEIQKCIDNDYEISGPVVMDYYPSNYCNYACIMCAPGASSKRLTFEIKVNNSLGTIIANGVNSDFYDLLNDVKILNLTGGETLLQKQVIELLDYIINNNIAKDMVITLLTNASSYPKSLLDKFNQFKKVIFVVSVDGTDKVIEYQRRGAKWETVSKNCLKIVNNPNFSTTINYVVTAVNIFSAMDFIDWLHKNNIAWFTISPVFRNEYLGITAIPDDLRKIVIDRLNTGLKKYETLNNKKLTNAIKTLLNMFDRASYDSAHLEKFKNHIIKEDQASNLKLIDVVPEWKQYFNSN